MCNQVQEGTQISPFVHHGKFIVQDSLRVFQVRGTERKTWPARLRDVMFRDFTERKGVRCPSGGSLAFLDPDTVRFLGAFRA